MTPAATEVLLKEGRKEGAKRAHYLRLYRFTATIRKNQFTGYRGSPRPVPLVVPPLPSPVASIAGPHPPRSHLASIFLSSAALIPRTRFINAEDSDPGYPFNHSRVVQRHFSYTRRRFPPPAVNSLLRKRSFSSRIKCQQR